MRFSFQATCSTPREVIWNGAIRTLSGTKEIHELRDAFDFLLIWREYLESVYEDLHTVTHLSNPDDPPDVIAHFQKSDLNIELTSLEPDHIHQSEPLKKQFSKTGHTVLPISYKHTSRAEAETIMAAPGHPHAWEDVSARCAVRKETVISRVTSKLENPRVQALNPGVILLTGDLIGDPNEELALLNAFEELAAHPQFNGWQFGTVHQWNDSSFYSTLYSTREGFRVRLHR